VGLLVVGRPAGDAAGLAVVLADRTEPAGATLAFQLAFAGPGDAGPGAGQPKADPGLGNDLDEAGPPAGQMLCHPMIQVLGPSGVVVAGMLITLIEMEQVDGPQRMPPCS
jgi:hypothetical protein